MMRLRPCSRGGGNGSDPSCCASQRSSGLTPSECAPSCSRPSAAGASARSHGRLADLAHVDLAEALRSTLDWRQRRELDELAPTHAVMPTGSRIPIDYGDPDAPSVSVRIQEVFGLAESPRVLNGGVALTMELLSPAHRPVQVTRDLAGFWRTSYFDVRKDLRGRYPRHEWPEDPLRAAPTRRAKPRR
jgi:ATP-dependent helicase HrpB